MGRLASLFGLRDALTRAASSDNRQRFAEVFAQSVVHFLCVPEKFAAGLPVDASQEEILRQIEQAAKDLSERQGFQPFTYVHGGERRLPVFSTEDMAAEFAQWYASETQRLVPLQVVGVAGAAVVPSFKDCDVVVLNDRTKYECLLSAEDVTLLQNESGLTRS